MRRRFAGVAALALAVALPVAHAQREVEEQRREIRVYPEGDAAPREPVEGVLEDEEGRGEIRVYPEGEVPPPEDVEGVLEDEQGRGTIRVYPVEEGDDSRHEAEAPPHEVWVPLGDPERPNAGARPADRDRDRDDGDGLACFLQAKDMTLLTDEEALSLCEFAPTAGPVACYRRAQDETTLREDQIMDLCRCASTTRAVDCVHEAQSETFLDPLQVIDLCRAVNLERRYWDCTPGFHAPARLGPIYVPPR